MKFIPMKPVTIIVGGDLAPTQTNYSFFCEGNLDALIDNRLLSLVNSFDYRIFNLEVPLTDTVKPIAKDGPNLIAPAAAVHGIRLLSPVILGMANNHILDHDEQGLLGTIEQLSDNQLSYVGAGKDLAEAAKPFIIEKDGVKVGIYACAENEFSIAGENRAGANPFDPLESPDHIVNLKSECDFVIVLHHGGKEHYRYPSPGLQKVCRKMADKGADLIICQHSHCIGAFEKYSDSIIVYGQGNFLFDRRNNEFWNTGLLVKASFGNDMSVDFIPTIKNGNGVALPESKVSETILNQFHERSENITKTGFIDSEYEKYCSLNGLFYLGASAGFGRITGKIDRMLNGFITRRIYSGDKLNMLLNFIECETHRELFLRYLHLRRKGE
jgi:poly-gamma-glutamate capsule biosynthesis protein CapA/YwtB (metallophosphatase superfamily)